MSTPAYFRIGGRSNIAVNAAWNGVGYMTEVAIYNRGSGRLTRIKESVAGRVPGFAAVQV